MRGRLRIEEEDDETHIPRWENMAQLLAKGTRDLKRKEGEDRKA